MAKLGHHNLRNQTQTLHAVYYACHNLMRLPNEDLNPACCVLCMLYPIRLPDNDLNGHRAPRAKRDDRLSRYSDIIASE